jgi:AcrR family transcriptional regulator
MSTYHHGDLPSAILQAAGKTLEKEGLGALSLRQVARKAGVSHNAPYRHFPDRDALLAALAAEGFDLLAEKLAANQGREMGAAYVRFALEHPQRFRLMFGGVIDLQKNPELARASAGAYGALVEAMKSQKEVSDPDTAAAAAWSLVHGLSHLLLDGHFAAAAGKDPMKFVDQVICSVRFVQRSA